MLLVSVRPHPSTGDGVGFELGILRADLGEGVGAGHHDGIGFLPLRQESFALLAADPDLLGGIVGLLNAGITHG